MNFKSASLEFQKLKNTDFELYYSLVSNPEIMQYITGEALDREAATTRFEHALLAGEAAVDLGVFLAYDSANGQLLGLIKMVPWSAEELEIGYILVPAYWGKGLGTEMAKAMIAHIQSLEIPYQIMAILDPKNLASVAVLTKAGLHWSEDLLWQGLSAAIYRL